SFCHLYLCTMIMHLLRSLFFVLMLSQPLTYTLFPYTTLFRSDAEFSPINSTLKKKSDKKITPRRRTIIRSTFFAIFPATIKAKGDRKSTRLNSSHVSISYAVFCLKKKK